MTRKSHLSPFARAPFATSRQVREALQGGISRRAFLSGLMAAGGATLASDFTFAQSDTTNKEALEGMAVEGEPPDYTLVATYGTYPLDLEYVVGKDGEIVRNIFSYPDQDAMRTVSGTFTYKSRTWAKDGVVDENFLGPVLELTQGETFRVKIVNKLFEEGDYADIGPVEPKPEDWLFLINRDLNEAISLHNLDPIGYSMTNSCTQDTDMSKFIIDEVNIPKNYNFVNLHTHGLQVTPHLFEPEGTLDKSADYITIKPGEEKTYAFSLPDDHPAGTFWYHPHRHNSVAIQAWSGMAGLILVRGKYDEELKSYGITTEIPFATHDPHYYPNTAPADGKPGIATIARFLPNQNESDAFTFLVSGRYRPEYTIKRGEIVLLRHLTATIENLCGFRIVKQEDSAKGPPKTDDVNHPFWIIASDGVAYDKPVKRTGMVTAGGERHDLLVQLSEPGVYEIWSDHLQTIQFYGTGPKDQMLATIRVTDEAATGQAPIEQMTFTPGIAPDKDIKAQEITNRRHLVFDMRTDTCRIPYPQFRINDRDYRPTDTWFDVKAGTAEEWVISSPSAATHPFHLHVTPFQVKENYSALTVRDDLLKDEADRRLAAARIAASQHLDRSNMWRDTIIIPPKGMLRIWVRFPENLTGKTVFHCHFLAHEETGMLQNFRIVP